MAWFRCMGGNGGEEPKGLPYVPSDSNYKISNIEIDALKASIDAYNAANNITAIDWTNANVICCIGPEVMWDTYSSQTAIKVRYFYIYSSNTVLSSFSTGKNFNNFEIGDSECTLTVNDGTYAQYKVYNRAIGDKYAGWCVDYASVGSLYRTYFGDDTLVEVASTASEGNFSYIPNYPAWVSKSFITADSLGNEKEFLHADNEEKTIIETQQFIIQDEITNPAIYDLTFIQNIKYALAFFGIDDNVNDNGSVFFNSNEVVYNAKFAWGIVPLKSTKVLTGHLPYSDGGAEFLYFAGIGMNKLPDEYAVRLYQGNSDTVSVTLDKVYDHIIIVNVFDVNTAYTGATISVNGSSLNYTELPAKWNRITYYGINEVEFNTTTLNFTYSTTPVNNKLLVFAYDD